MHKRQRDKNHGGDHYHIYHHEDHNLKAAYLHVLAAPLTSILAIIALLAGKYFGLVALDPLNGNHRWHIDLALGLVTAQIQWFRWQP